MTVLVTGASGFVGRRLAETLRTRGFKVRVVVRSFDSNFDADQVLLPINPTDCEAWRPIIRGCNTVVHLIARAHIISEYASDPLEQYTEINVGITSACAYASIHENVNRFLFLSTIGVHGDCSYLHPVKFDDPFDPRSLYAISKLAAEQELLNIISMQRETRCVILRSPLVYGPCAPGNFGRLVRLLRGGIPLPFASISENRRSFVSLDNLVDLIICCIDHPACIAANQTFLVSDGEDLSTADLLRRIGGALGLPVRLFPVPVRVLRMFADLLNRRDLAKQLLGNLQVDIDHTRDTLQWAPPFTVSEGLRRACS